MALAVPVLDGHVRVIECRDGVQIGQLVDGVPPPGLLDTVQIVGVLHRPDVQRARPDRLLNPADGLEPFQHRGQRSRQTLYKRFFLDG